MPTIKTWCGQTPNIVKGRLIRDTGTGLIVEDARGVRYFAQNHYVIARDDEDLFSPIS